MSDGRLVLGVPAAAHREALLRETASGGRVPVDTVAPLVHPCAVRCWYTSEPATIEEGVCDECGDDSGIEKAIVLAHPTDPEVGAMGLRRLAFVAPDLALLMEDCVRGRCSVEYAAGEAVREGILDRVEIVDAS